VKEKLMTKRILRPKQIMARLGIGSTKFWEDFVATKRVKLFPIGSRARGALEEDIDRLIEQMAREGEERRNAR
jgi:predicted DNA-binding transcriptional regulator AlpA